MSGVYIAIIILAVIGIPLLLYIGIKEFWGGRRLNEPSRHPGRPDHVHCPACHERNAGNAEFCEKCGHRLRAATGGRA
jgi:hypothetical protein